MPLRGRGSRCSPRPLRGTSLTLNTLYAMTPPTIVGTSKGKARNDILPRPWPCGMNQTKMRKWLLILGACGVYAAVVAVPILPEAWRYSISPTGLLRRAYGAQMAWRHPEVIAPARDLFSALVLHDRAAIAERVPEQELNRVLHAAASRYVTDRTWRDARLEGGSIERDTAWLVFRVPLSQGDDWFNVTVARLRTEWNVVNAHPDGHW